MGVGVAESACSSRRALADLGLFSRPQGGPWRSRSTHRTGRRARPGLHSRRLDRRTFRLAAAFVAVGLPGILLAVFARLVIREPERGASDTGAVDATSYTARERSLTCSGGRLLWRNILGSSLFISRARRSIPGRRCSHASSRTAQRRSRVVDGCPGCERRSHRGDHVRLACGSAVRADLRWNLWVATGGLALVVPGTLLFLSARALVPLYYFLTVFCNAVYMGRPSQSRRR